MDAPPNSEPPLSVSNLLNQSLRHDRYRLLKRLGQGVGSTFLAVDGQTSQPCVVKRLPRHAIAHLFTFHQALHLGELGEHPQIPRLLDTFEQDGNAFIVQEWIDGWTLAQETEGVPFNEVEVRQVLQALLPVLAYLHDRQIMHCDIKPANIIRRKSDHQLVLVDFGAAKHLSYDRLTHAETLMGSVEYAAPEQIQGQAVFASDLYSLGATCLYLLTQTSPFDWYDIVENDWKWQAYLPQPLSADLKAMLCKLLQPAIRRRYQTAAAVLADVAAASISTSVSTGDQPLPLNAAIATTPTPASRSETDRLGDLSAIVRLVQATYSLSGATVYLPQSQSWYVLPGSTTTSEASRTAFFLSPRRSTRLGAEAKNAIDLVFSVMLIFMLTCIGLMLMLCFVSEMELRYPHKSYEPSRTH